MTLASRALPATRALLNEADLAAYVEAHWEATVVPASFTESLFDTLELMAQTDVLLGMHGAPAYTDANRTHGASGLRKQAHFCAVVIRSSGWGDPASEKIYLLGRERCNNTFELQKNIRTTDLLVCMSDSVLDDGKI